MSQYSRLDSGASMPTFPPAYNDSETLPPFPAEAAASMEQFEIDEDEVYEPAKRDLFLTRALFVSKSIVFCCHDRFVRKFSCVIDPIYEGCSYFNHKYELAITRVGNPLVIKRLLYVLVVILGMYLITLGESNEGISGLSGDAFSVGRFYDMTKLGDSLASYITSASLEVNLEYLSVMPHAAGTAGDLALAKYVKEHFSNNGLLMAQIHELESFLNYPKVTNTFLKLSDGSFQATLHEDVESEMSNLAFSPNSPNTAGEIEAPYLFVNYGEAGDLENIERAGVKVEGAIFLVKYGGDTPEPNKILAASRLGAKAVIFISPETDWAGVKSDNTIQRKNVALTRVSPGDVLTPGFSAQDNAIGKLSWEASEITAKIPAIPISHKDGKALVARLKNGHDFGDGWVSGTASADNKIKLNIENEERLTHLLWNVYGYIAGREQADRGIIFGATRDSGCYGASTSASGTAALMELVKAFTSLQRRYDWSPARSIYFVSFDATEYNLAGSTEWVKSRIKELKKEGYVYIDVDEIATGETLSISASPLMHDCIKTEMQKVKLLDKQKSDGMKTLLDLYRSQNNGKDRIPYNMLENKNYIPFINLLGMPSVDIGLRGNRVPKSSCSDSFVHLELEISMEQYAQVVELLARVGLSLSETPIIPFDFAVLAERMNDYITDLEKFSKDKTNGELKLLYNKVKGAIEMLKSFGNRINRFRKERDALVSDSSSLEPTILSAARRNLNYNMIEFQSAFTLESNGESRPGYLSLLFGVSFYAPEFDDKKYEWNSFPFVRDQIIEGNAAKAQHELDRVAEMLDVAARQFFE